MLTQLEDEELLVLGTPVAADAFEDPRAVMQGVGHQPEAGIGVALELAIQIDPVLRLLFLPGLSRAGDALCLDRHSETTSFCAFRTGCENWVRCRSPEP